MKKVLFLKKIDFLIRNTHDFAKVMMMFQFNTDWVNYYVDFIYDDDIISNYDELVGGDQHTAKYKDKKETIMKLVDKNYDILDTYYEDEGLMNGLETYAKKRYNHFKSQYENDEDMKKKIEQDSELLILNSSDEHIVSIKEI